VFLANGAVETSEYDSDRGCGKSCSFGFGLVFELDVGVSVRGGLLGVPLDEAATQRLAQIDYQGGPEGTLPGGPGDVIKGLLDGQGGGREFIVVYREFIVVCRGTEEMGWDLVGRSFGLGKGRGSPGGVVP